MKKWLIYEDKGNLAGW